MNETIHVEVYLKTEEKTYISYEIEDKDDEVLFSTFILADCLQQFGRCEKKKEILFISVDELKRRFMLMKKKFIIFPENILYKINCLINHIEKNKKNYYGIRTIYSI